MAYTQELPVYKSIYNLFISICKVIQNMSKSYRPTIWDEIRKTCLELLSSIFWINAIENSIERKKVISKSIIIWEQVRMLTDVLNDLSLISKDDYRKLSMHEVEILKQLQGWKNSY